MEVVKSTDSIEWVSCSTIIGVVLDGDLFYLFSQIIGDTLSDLYKPTQGCFDCLGVAIY